jgi:hypothetical protein
MVVRLSLQVVLSIGVDVAEYVVRVEVGSVTTITDELAV